VSPGSRRTFRQSIAQDKGVASILIVDDDRERRTRLARFRRTMAFRSKPRAMLSGWSAPSNRAGTPRLFST